MTDRIDVAVLGLGKMGGTHVKAAKDSPYVNRVYGYEPEKNFAAKRGAELGIEATSDLGLILKNPGIRLVCIAAVNSAHAELTERALASGKAVMCEKPMGETLDEARRMISAEKSTGNFLQIGFELRYSMLYMKAKEWIDSGLIGTPVNCHCRYYCSEFHGRDSWRSRSAGTLIGEKLSHYIDLQRWFAGDEIEEVYSFNAPNAVGYFNHPDNHQINFRFKKGSVSTLNFVMYLGEHYEADPLIDPLEKQADDGHSLEYRIMGTKGIIHTDVFRRRLRRHELSEGDKCLVNRIAEEIAYGKGEDSQWIHNTHGQNIRICELVAKGKPPETPASDSYETMKAGFAAEISEREKRIVKMEEPGWASAAPGEVHGENMPQPASGAALRPIRRQRPRGSFSGF